MPYSLNPDFAAAAAKLFGTEPPPALPVGDVQSRRAQVGFFFELLSSLNPAATDVDTKDFWAKADDGTDILCRWFTKQNSSPPGSAILYAHGGGMIAMSLKEYDFILRNYVSKTGVPFLAVDYRLAPEHPAPIPVTDTFAGLKYLHEHASELGVDPERIAVMGDSGGGGVAASLTHYVKKKGGPKISKQILVYPMLDDRTVELDEGIVPYAAWKVDDNKTGWQALLGDRYGTDDVGPIDAAGRMTVEDARGLPDCYIDVGELDLFCKEDIKYMSTLTEAGVTCEFHLIPHIPHGAEGVAPQADFAQLVSQLRCAAVKKV